MLDILIAGAGPVGLALANDLLRWNVSFRIVDRKDQPERHSKAGNLWPRTQEALAPGGTLERLRQAAIRYDTVMVYGYGTRLGTQPANQFPSPYPEAIQPGQNQIETILSDRVQEVGQPVNWQHEVIGLQQHADHVTVTIRRADGQTETVACRYVVGCDGSHSRVRDLAGLSFDTEELPGRSIWQIDARLRWSRSMRNNQMWFFLFDTGYLTAIPIPGGYHRIWIFRERDALPDRKLTVEEMQAAAREIVGDSTLELSDPIWFSYQKSLRTGIAPSFCRNRIFLAGDAGHVSLPIGGQGMNTGIQDAFNLGWKLAAVLQGRAHPMLLDSYNAERHTVRNDLLKDQKSGFASTTHPSAAQKLLVRWAGPVLMNMGIKGGPELAGRRDAAMLDINYPDSPLTVDVLSGGSLKAGDRALDALVVTTPDFRTINLFELLYNGNWTSLLFMNDELNESFTKILVPTQPYSFIQRYVLLTTPNGSLQLPADTHLLRDSDRFAHLAYDVSRPSFFLIRPDGHVALRCSPTQTVEFTNYLKRVFLPVSSA